MADPIIPLVMPGAAQGAAPQPRMLPTGVAAPPEWQSPSLNYISGLLSSTASGMTELVGVTLPGAEEFRIEHPIVGTASQLASVIVPYGGWFAAARKVGPLMRAAERVAKVSENPFVSGAAREATILAPFEVARTTASQVLPWSDKSIDQMAGEATWDLALSGGIGGLLHTVAAAGKRAARVPIPGLDLAAPPPLQIRKLKELLATTENPLTIEQQGAAVNKLKTLDQKARTEEPGRNGKYVSKVNGNEALTRELNALFTPGGEGATQKKMYASGTKYGFGTEAEWKQASTYDYLPDNFAETGRYFRQISFKPTGHTIERAEDIRALGDAMAAKEMTPEEFSALTERLASEGHAGARAAKIDKLLRENMQSVGFGWLLAREEGGLYVVAKKTHGKFGEGKVTDRWVLFKTDMPGAFGPMKKNKAFSDLVLEGNSWQLGAAPLENVGPVYGATANFLGTIDADTIDVAGKRGVLDKILPKGLAKQSDEFVKGFGDSFREYLAPAAAQFRKSPLAQKVFMTMKIAYNKADTIAHEITYGRLLPGERNLFLESLTPGRIDPEIDSISSITGPLNDVQSAALQELRAQAQRGQLDPSHYDEMVASGVLDPAVRNAADRLEAIANVMDVDHQALAFAMGDRVAKRPPGTLGLRPEWEGDARIQLDSESGTPIAVIGGKTKAQAQALAKRIVEESAQSDMPLHIGQSIDISKLSRLQKRGVAVSDAIMSTVEGGEGLPGLRGFKGDYEAVPRKELLTDFQRAYAKRLQYQATKAVEDLTAQDRAILNETDPNIARMLEDRWDAMKGKQGKFSKAQNEYVDLVLAPSLGPNSATKIVRATNEGLVHWHLGMGNIAQPIMTVLTFMNTVVPEVANVIGMAKRGWNNANYSFYLANGTRGPIAAGAWLSPWKILFNSFREMARPSEQLLRFFARSGAEGRTQPRYAEEYIGQNATKVRNLREAFASPGGFVAWLKELSAWLPANAERLSRVHAFTTGYIMGRDVLGIVDEEALYRFAADFNEKTMYAYTTADKPKIFTSPIGSSMGLFKTWMMNYMASMVEYSGQAVRGNVAPLFWQTAGTAAVGGLAATPLYWIADGFSRAFLSGSMLQETYDNLSEGPADALMFGMPAALTGISLYSQSTSPMSNPQRDASMLWSSVLYNRAQALGRVVGASYDRWHATGEHPGSDPQVRNAIFQALAPSTISRAIAAFSGEDVIRSMSTGYPLIGSVPIGDRLLYAMKLNPVELDRAMAVADELYRDRAKERSMVMQLGRAFADASDRGDSDQIDLIMMQTMAWGIDPSKVLSSAMRRGELESEPLLERTFGPQKLEAYGPALGQ